MKSNQSVTIVEQIYFSPEDTAKRAGISRSYVYILNKKYGFVHKIGRRSLIKWSDFEEALKKEFIGG